MELKLSLGILAVIITIASYLKYLKDVFAGKTKPHVYTWIVWALLGGIVFALQISFGAGAGAYMTLTGTLMCGLVAVLGLRNGLGYITPADTAFLIVAIISLVLWLLVKQPLVSAILVTSAGIVGFIPTFRKGWFQPHEETVGFYILNTLRFGIAILALQTYNFITVFDPTIFMFANGLFSLVLLIRRRRLL